MDCDRSICYMQDGCDTCPIFLAEEIRNRKANYDIAKTVDELSNEDFYGVFVDLSSLNNINGIDDLVEWLREVLYEIEAEIVERKVQNK